MGVGPNNMGLDKGHVATGTVAYTAGECVVSAGTGTSCARATSAGALIRGVCMESIDASRVTTGKAVINIRMEGIARVLAGAAVAVDAWVTNDATCRAVARTKAAAGAQPGNVFGIALTAATAAGQYIDVLLTPASQY